MPSSGRARTCSVARSNRAASHPKHVPLIGRRTGQSTTPHAIAIQQANSAKKSLNNMLRDPKRIGEAVKSFFSPKGPGQIRDAQRHLKAAKAKRKATNPRVIAKNKHTR